MNSSKIKIIGRCCNNKASYLVVYNGNPCSNYSLLICNEHMNTEPFNREILETKKIGDD